MRLPSASAVGKIQREACEVMVGACKCQAGAGQPGGEKERRLRKTYYRVRGRSEALSEGKKAPRPRTSCHGRHGDAAEGSGAGRVASGLPGGGGNGCLRLGGGLVVRHVFLRPLRINGRSGEH